MQNDKEILNEIKRTVQEIVPDAEIILFGSRASGKIHDESDWDILIFINNTADRQLKDKIRERIYLLQWKYSVMIQTVIVGKKEWYNNPSYYSLRINISENPTLAL